MNMIRSAIAGILALFAVASASAQQFPTVPDRTVIGRIGVGGQSGPSQAIPFANFLANFGGTQAANTVWAGPSSGAAASPTFRLLTSPDLSALLASSNTWTGNQYFKSGKPWADVRAWGAVCDNSTDDTTAIQNAINSLTGGGVVYIPPGFCKISAALTISVQGVSVIGANRLSAIIRTTSATANIFTITASYAKIDSLGLIGTTGQVQTAGSAISATGAQSNVFTNLFISDVFSGIDMNNATNNLVRGVKLLNIYGTFGLRTTNGGGDVIVDNQIDPVFYGAYTSASGFGAWATGTVYALNQVRSANGGFFVVTQAGTSAGAGGGPVISPFGTTIVDNTVRWLFITAGNSIGINANTVSNSNFIAYNDVSGPWGTGINISGSDGNILQVNTIGQILGNGIQLGTSATNTLVQGNVVSGAYGQFSLGIADLTSGTGTATGTRIRDNYVQGTGWYGIFVASQHTSVTGNFVQSYGQVTGAWGIAVSANVNNFTISNNTIVPSSNGTIQVAAGTSNVYVISGNMLEGTDVTDGGTGTNKTISGNVKSTALVTTQVFTTGTNATYTKPAGVTRIEVELQAGGGGGAGSGTTPGAAGVGGNSCWNTSSPACTTPLYQATGGTLGSAAGAVAAGGGIAGSLTCNDSVLGGNGMAATAVLNTIGGQGGGTSLGQGGAAGSVGTAAGALVAANTGAGGGGAGDGGTANTGGGGAGGGKCYFATPWPAATYFYTVGALGTAGTAGTSGFAGAAGSAGKIRVNEYYN